jgi:hypothetical protein
MKMTDYTYLKYLVFNDYYELRLLRSGDAGSRGSEAVVLLALCRTGEPSGRASDNTSPSKASQKSPGVKRIAFAGPSPLDSPRDSGDASPTKDGSRRSSLFSVDDDHPMVKVLRTINTKRWTGRVRYLAVRIISSPDFELLVILLIFGNCISLSMLRPQEGEDSVWNQRLNTVELVLNACFTVEVILRIVAIGGVFVSWPRSGNFIRCRPLILRVLYPISHCSRRLQRSHSLLSEGTN